MKKIVGRKEEYRSENERLNEPERTGKTSAGRRTSGNSGNTLTQRKKEKEKGQKTTKKKTNQIKSPTLIW